MSARVHTAQATPWSNTSQSVLVKVRAWIELCSFLHVTAQWVSLHKGQFLTVCVFVQQNLYKCVVDIHLPYMYVPVCTSSMWVRTAVASVRFSVWTWMDLWINGWFMFHVGMDCNTITWIFNMNLDLWICNWSKFHVRIVCDWFCPLDVLCDLGSVNLWRVQVPYEYWLQYRQLTLRSPTVLILVLGSFHKPSWLGTCTMLYEPDLCPCCCAVIATCWISKPLWKCVILSWIGNAACVCESV